MYGSVFERTSEVCDKFQTKGSAYKFSTNKKPLELSSFSFAYSNVGCPPAQATPPKDEKKHTKSIKDNNKTEPYR